MKKYLYITILACIIILDSSFNPALKPQYTFKTVVIAPGHGGKDPGCHGSKYKEKDIALAVSLQLGKYIEDNFKDVKVVYTRKTDIFVGLQEQAEIANRAKADLFICVHCNSACVRDKKTRRDVCRDQVHGAETYVMGIKNEKGKLDVAKRENSSILLEDDYVKKYEGFDPNSDESYIIMSMFNDTYLNQSLSFATKVQKQYTGKAGRIDKGVKRASLWVLWRTYMPSVLTEIGYLTNPEEENFLGSEKGQSYVASSLFRAFREYKDELEGTVKKYDDDFEKQEAYKLSKEDSLQMEKEKQEKVSETIDTKEKEQPKKEEKKEETKKEIVKEEKVILPKVEEKKEETKKEIVKERKETQEKSSEVSEKEKNKINNVVNNLVVYKVQIISSMKKISLDDERFKNIEKVGEYTDNNIYKYTAGEFLNKEDAMHLQQDLKKNGFKDAFVIATQNGKRITGK